MDNAQSRTQRAIETTGVLDEAGRLHLDAPLEETVSQAVRVILLFEEDEEDIGERAWLRAVSRNPAFDFLRDPAEDLYTTEDGTPFEEGAESDEDA